MVLLSQVFELIIFPILIALSAYIIKWINAKTNEISAARTNELEKKYLAMLNETITNCVIATSQTYVNTLKKEGRFDIEAQKIAFEKTYNAVCDILTADAKEVLTLAIGDLNLYITQKIEAEVNLTK